jgi:hypothetical protein
VGSGRARPVSRRGASVAFASARRQSAPPPPILCLEPPVPCAAADRHPACFSALREEDARASRQVVSGYTLKEETEMKDQHRFSARRWIALPVVLAAVALPAAASAYPVIPDDPSGGAFASSGQRWMADHSQKSAKHLKKAHGKMRRR